MKSTWPPMPEKKRPPIESAGQVDGEGGVQRDHLVVSGDLERVVREARGAHLDGCVVVHPVVERARSHDE
jgi:hypothetical protein